MANTEWKPIESAPKDGTRILLYATLRGSSLGGCDRGKNYGEWIVLGAWEVEYGMWWDGSQCTVHPTHWMPLPAAPEVVRPAQV